MIQQRHTISSGFSLVEVVLAMGLTSFVLVAITGLLSVSLTGVSNSEMKLTAANAASEVLQERTAAPTNTLVNCAIASLIPASLPTSAASAQSNTVMIGAGGDIAAAGQAQFRLTSRVWRDTVSASDPGSSLVRIHLLLSWPPAAPATNAAIQYDVMTSILVN